MRWTLPYLSATRRKTFGRMVAHSTVLALVLALIQIVLFPAPSQATAQPSVARPAAASMPPAVAASQPVSPGSTRATSPKSPATANATPMRPSAHPASDGPAPGTKTRKVTLPTTPPAKASTPTSKKATSVTALASWSVTLTATTTSDLRIYLQAAANQSLQGTGNTLAIYDKTTGVRLGACGDTTVNCNGNGNASSGFYWYAITIVPTATTSALSGKAHDYVATIAPGNDASYPPAGVAATSTVVNQPAWSVSLTTGTTSDFRVSLQALSNYSLSGSGYTLAIYDTTTGQRLKACNNPTPCTGNAVNGNHYIQVSFVPTATTTALSGKPHSYVAVVAADSALYPPTNLAATSGTITEPAWSVSLTTGTLSGLRLYLQAASNYSLSGSGYTLAIYDTTTGQRLTACNNPTPCNSYAYVGDRYIDVTFVPTATTTALSHKAHSYVAVVAADSAAYPAGNIAATSNVITEPAWALDLHLLLSTDHTNFTIEAVSNYSLSPSTYTLAIWDLTTGTRLSACNPSPNPACSVNFPIAYNSWWVSGSTLWGHNFVATISDDSTTYLPSNVAAISRQSSPTPTGPQPNESIGGCNPVENFQCLASAADPVDLDNGNYFDSENDLRVPGRGIPLNLNRTYDTRMASTSGPLGYGWTDSYNWLLSVNTPAAGQITVRQSGGSKVVFSPDGVGGYTAPTRVLATLIKNSDGTYTYTARERTIYSFTSAGKLQSFKDLNGYATTLSYDGSGRLSAVTDSTGRKLTFSYDTSNRIKTVTDPLPRTVTYGYDTSGNLHTVTDVDGRVWTYGYDSAHRLTTRTNPRGNTVTNTYDPSTGRVSKQSDRRGKITLFDYGTIATDGSHVTTVTRPRGMKDSYSFVAAQMTQVVRGVGTADATIEKRTYDAITNGVSAITDGRNHTTSFTYDLRGNRLTQTDPLNRTTTWTYNAFDEPLTEKDPLGVTTTYTYDTHGNLATTSRPLTGSSPAQTFTTVNNYGDPAHPGDVTSATDPRGKVSIFKLDAYGDVTAVTDATGRKTVTTYNVVGWPLTQVSAGNHTTVFSDFTGFGKPKKVTDPLGHVSTTVFDANQNATDTTDADGRHTHKDYDAADQLLTVTKPDGSTENTSYDDDGNIATQTDGLGHITSYGYDNLDRQISIKDAAGRISTQTYDAASNVATIAQPGAGTAILATTNTHDNADQLTGVSYSDGLTHNVIYTYDADGQRKTMVDGTGTTTYVVDSLHRLAQVTTGAGQVVKYGYDLAGNATSITYPNGSNVTRSYDDAGRLNSVQDWLGGSATTFGYDGDGRWASTIYANGVSSSLGYDNAGGLTSIAYKKGATGIGTYTYTRTSAELPATAASSAGAPGSSQTYAYTADGQLKSTAGAAATTVWTYDSADRITKNPAGTIFAYDTVDQLKTSTPTSGAATAYVYDSRGNRTSAKVGTAAATGYGYNQANQLTSFTTPAGATTTYTYDGDGMRTAKTPAGGTAQAMTWDIANPGLPVLLSDTGSFYIYGPGGTPIEQIQGNAAVYLHQDQLGSTCLITNASGTVTGKYAYDPYGKPTHSLTAITAFQFAGEYMDAESGFVYLRARYYDPATGQFVTVDPLNSLTRTRYSYGLDNPLVYTDPSGLICFSVSCLVGDGASLYAKTPAGLLLGYGAHVSRLTIGTCVGGQVVQGFASVGTICYVATPSGKSAFTATGGGGASTLGFGGSGFVGITVSNAQVPSDLYGPFTYLGGGAGWRQYSGSASYAWGSNSCGDYIWQATGGWSPALPSVLPFSFDGGETYTIGAESR